MENKLSKADVLYTAWNRGLLQFKLDVCQKEIYEQISKSSEKIQVVLSSRRLGKSYVGCILALQQCLSKPNSVVKFLAPTKLMIQTILRPLLKQILDDCPEVLQPAQNKSQFTYYFKNGSELHLAGSDAGHAEKLRGSFANLCIVDEAGFCDNLLDVVRSILIPTTLNTKGKIVLLSTPPKDPEHDFLKFIEEADINSTLIKKTIYDNKRITTDEIEEILKAYPNREKDPEFRREFLCELIRDKSLVVIPQFTEELEKEIVKEWPVPPYYHCYESMDLGFKDMTVVLFAYYDFRAARLIIQDEIALQGNEVQIPSLIAQIKQKELDLWTDVFTNETKKPYLRVSDINYIVTEEINRASKYEINFTPARKDDKEAAINSLQVMLEQGKIIINPKCKVLIRHLRNAKWSKRKNQRVFDRGADGSHFDALDSIIYLTRHVDYTNNPYPKGHGMGFRQEDFFTPKPQNWVNNSQTEIFKKMFNIRKNNVRR